MMCNTSNSVGRVPTAASHTTFVVRVSALRFVLSLCFRVCHVILMLPGQLIGYTVSAKQSSFFFFSFFLGYSSSPLSPSLPRSLAPSLPRSPSLSLSPSLPLPLHCACVPVVTPTHVSLQARTRTMSRQTPSSAWVVRSCPSTTS